ncbi:hypothetical protein DFQ26_002478, partial [Actinomortierella ambigua]
MAPKLDRRQPQMAHKLDRRQPQVAHKLDRRQPQVAPKLDRRQPQVLYKLLRHNPVLARFYLDLTFDSSGAARTSKHWFLRNRWDAKKAKTGTMDIAIDAILRLGGGSSTVPRQKLQEKAEASMPQASPTPPIDGNFVLGIGSGEFRGKQQYSLHGPFLRRLVSKAKPLGIICCKVKEAYTSK